MSTENTFKTRSLQAVNEVNNSSEKNPQNIYLTTIFNDSEIDNRNNTKFPNKNLSNNNTKNQIIIGRNKIDNVENKYNSTNKTVVKRNINEENLVFWNDLYDEEYGIKVDPLKGYENKRELSSNRKKTKKSENWLKKEVMKLKKSLHHKDNVNKLKENLDKKLHRHHKGPHDTIKNDRIPPYRYRLVKACK